MSASTTAKAGPAIGTIREARGVFASEAALQDAIGLLTRAGFDRADLSLPTYALSPSEMTPDQGATAPDTDDDARQLRTLQTSLAGSVGAVAAAGAVIATGGAALPAVLAAASVGIGVGGLAHAANTVGTDLRSEDRADAAARGQLVLSVRIAGPTSESNAQAALREAGATDIRIFERS